MSAAAWLLPVDDQQIAAAGELEVLHILQFPTLHPIPGSPYFCRQVIFWQDRVLPAIDLRALIDQQASHTDYPIAAITAYQTTPGEYPQFGALLLSALPQKVQVEDDQLCALPPERPLWRKIALSCFNYRDTAVPILNLNHLYSPALASDALMTLPMVKPCTNIENSTTT